MNRVKLCNDNEFVLKSQLNRGKVILMQNNAGLVDVWNHARSFVPG